MYDIHIFLVLLTCISYAMDNGQEVVDKWDHKPVSCQLIKHDQPAMSVAFQLRNSLLAIGYGLGAVRLYNYLQGCAKPKRGFRVLADQIYAVSFSKDGRYLIVGSNQSGICVWDIEQNMPYLRIGKNAEKVFSMIFLDDDRRCIVGRFNGEISQYDIRTPEVLGKLQGHHNIVESLAANPQNEHVFASGSDDGCVHVWDLRNMSTWGSVIRRYLPLFAIAYHPNGNLIASGNSMGEVHMQTSVGDSAVKSTQVPGAGLDCWIKALTFSPRGKSLICMDSQGGITSWVHEKDQQVVLAEKSSFELFSLSSHALAFSPDGNTLAAAHNKLNLLYARMSSCVVPK